MLFFELIAEEHPYLLTPGYPVYSEYFLSNREVFEDDDGSVSLVVEGLLVLRTKLIESIESLDHFIIFFLVFLNLALIKALYFLLILSVKWLNLLNDECLLIFKLSNFSPDSVKQMLDFVTFQIFEDEAEISYVWLGRIANFEPFDDE